MVREVIREGDHVRVVKGKYACHRLAVVVQCTNKCVYLRFEGCHEAKLVKQISVVLVEDLETLALRVQNLRIALREAEAHLAQKQEMVNKEKTQTKAKAEERANVYQGIFRRNDETAMQG
jgi:exonuclease I